MFKLNVFFNCGTKNSTFIYSSRADAERTADMLFALSQEGRFSPFSYTITEPVIVNDKEVCPSLVSLIRILKSLPVEYRQTVACIKVLRDLYGSSFQEAKYCYDLIQASDATS